MSKCVGSPGSKATTWETQVVPLNGRGLLNLWLVVVVVVLGRSGKLVPHVPLSLHCTHPLSHVTWLGT